MAPLLESHIENWKISEWRPPRALLKNRISHRELKVAGKVVADAEKDFESHIENWKSTSMSTSLGASPNFWISHRELKGKVILESPTPCAYPESHIENWKRSRRCMLVLMCLAESHIENWKTLLMLITLAPLLESHIENWKITVKPPDQLRPKESHIENWKCRLVCCIRLGLLLRNLT